MPSQEEIGDWLGLDQSQVSRRLAELELDGASVDMRTIVRAYCAALRDAAAGRSSDLVKERARLAAEQADRVAMENALRRKELAPVAMMQVALADVGGRINTILSAIPVHIRRRWGQIDPDLLQIIQREVQSATDLCADIQLDDEGDNADTTAQPSDSERANRDSDPGALEAVAMG